MNRKKDRIKKIGRRIPAEKDSIIIRFRRTDDPLPKKETGVIYVGWKDIEDERITEEEEEDQS